MSRSGSAWHNEELWKVLVDTVHALPMYKNHRRYVEDVLIKEKPEISAQELSVQLNIPLGEAIVLLDELKSGSPIPASDNQKTTRSSTPTLLDYAV